MKRLQGLWKHSKTGWVIQNKSTEIVGEVAELSRSRDAIKSYVILIRSGFIDYTYLEKTFRGTHLAHKRQGAMK